MHFSGCVKNCQGERTQPHLARNVGNVYLLGVEIMDLVIALHSFLMDLLALLFPAFALPGIPGQKRWAFF